MTKKVPNKPSWFNISKYENLKLLSSKQLCREVKFRLLQINHFKYKMLNANQTDDITSSHFEEELTTLCRQHGGFYKTHDYLIKNQLKIDISGLTFPLEYLTDFYNEIDNGYSLTKNQNFNSVSEISYQDLHSKMGQPTLICQFYEKYNKYLNGDYPESLIEAQNKISQEYNNLAITNQQIDSIDVSFPKGNFGESVKDEIESMEVLFSFTPLYFSINNSLGLGYFKIDLSSPDEVIIDELISQVRDLRQKNIESEANLPINLVKDNKKHGGKREIKSLIENRVIPFIDLQIWALEKGYDLTNQWYMFILFQDHLEKNMILPQNKMSETIKPCANKWKNENWLSSFYRFDIEPLNN